MTPGARARDVGVVIVAAGASTRSGGPAGELKQLRWIAGKPMLLHSVLAFQQRDDVAMVVCVLPARFAGDPPPWLFQGDLDRLLISVGGNVRGESVENGLEDLTDDCRIVLIHDAARPFASPDLISYAFPPGAQKAEWPRRNCPVSSRQSNKKSPALVAACRCRS